MTLGFAGIAMGIGVGKVGTSAIEATGVEI
jgi:F0F1-type ATP synthase membrane subunit c/vacuolar-type H+-ATPase subunit K